jgi:hypothetical protein
MIITIDCKRAEHHGWMADTEGIWGEDARWYPDIVAAGDACRAWQAEFDRQGAAVQVRQWGGDRPYLYATAGESDGPNANLMLWRRERKFRLALRTGKFWMLHGFAADLATAARAAQSWLGGARPGEVAAAWPFLGSIALAEARERRDVREAAWLNMYENHMGNPVTLPTQPFIALAFHEPRLRALRPYTSHTILCFSKTAEYPFSMDLPIVEPATAPGRFVVRTRDGRVFDETDAAGALRIVLSELET